MMLTVAEKPEYIGFPVEVFPRHGTVEGKLPCVREVLHVHILAFLPMNGYFTGEELQLMTTHGRHLESSIFEMMELFRKGEADEVHIIEYPTAVFIKHLGDAGARETLTSFFQMAIKELAMVAVFSFLVVVQGAVFVHHEGVRQADALERVYPAAGHESAASGQVLRTAEPRPQGETPQGAAQTCARI